MSTWGLPGIGSGVRYKRVFITALIQSGLLTLDWRDEPFRTAKRAEDTL